MYSTYSTYPYTTNSVNVGAGLFAGFFGVFFVLCVIAWIVVTIIAEWKIFTKAGKEGWKALIPIYNAYSLLQILNMEPMLCFLSILPGANFMLGIVMNVRLAKSFGKGTGFAIGLILLEPIFLMILGFGDAKYKQLPSTK